MQIPELRAGTSNGYGKNRRTREIEKTVRRLGERWKVDEAKMFSEKVFSIYSWAGNAGMEDIYCRHYAQLSRFAHVSVETLITSQLSIMPGHILIHVIFALNEATTRIARAYRETLPREMILQAEEFNRLFKAYDKNGNLKRFLYHDMKAGHPTKPKAPNARYERN